MAEEAAKKDKGGGMKMIIIIVAAVLLLAGVGAGAFFLGSSKASAAKGAQGEGAAAETAAPAEGAEAGAVGPLVALEDFIVNIMDGQETRYLKAAITLEMTSEDAAAEIDQRKAQVRDAVLLLIGSKTYDELRDLQGKLQLRADLIGRLNSFLTRGRVSKIYFTDFVVQ
ncbi:hypothetical protein DESUT3_36950 [Desulfuromonas versatilis]|uniref:Flagellar protein FliL n=1 Tax=Desulfuromonas versatilis TaxID=2802975 RepID=A0ABM8HX83_9BACT|nr:flagellar basal body-associated FliL family protein [Desulfuromonas versatilis]BCR06626.1 hypothetical protein DESUT3_36950 [Desulfuromonas versatilis]